MENSDKLKKAESVEKKPKTTKATKTAEAANSAGTNQNVNANSAKNEQQLISANKLILVGAHIGLNATKWNPKMAPYIFAKKNNNHIIDVNKSLVFLRVACNYLRQVAANGGKVLIVGTRGKVLKEYIKADALRSNSFYVTQRWLGGTLTNFKNIRKSIKKMNDYEKAITDGTINNYTKKEQLLMQKEFEKLQKFYGGIGNMRNIPNVLIVLDPVNDINAIMEARKLSIPVIALANTNADPSLVDYIIPINNHSIKSVVLLLNILVDAICLGQGLPTKVSGIPEDEIEIVEQPQRKPKVHLNHKKFSKHSK